MTDTKDYYRSDAKHLILDIPVPYQEMLREAINLRHRFTDHRPNENKHKGWKSLTLYGLDENRHENWDIEGYSSALDAAKDFKWTSAAYDCPITLDFLLNTFPSKRYGRVRLMLVEPGGYIGFHSDTKHRILENINIPLSNPKNCIWHWRDGEKFFMEPGISYAVNISYEHSITNDSDEDRYHLIVARHDSTDEWKQLIDVASRKYNIEGYYQNHLIMV